MTTKTTNIIKQLDEKVSGSNKKETGSEKKKADTGKTKPQNQKKKHKPNKNQQKKNKGHQKSLDNEKKAEKKAKKDTPKEIKYHGTMTVDELAGKLNVDVSEIIKKLMFLGVMATKNQDLDDDAIELICSEYGVEATKEIILEDRSEEHTSELQSRGHIVCRLLLEK